MARVALLRAQATAIGPCDFKTNSVKSNTIIGSDALCLMYVTSHDQCVCVCTG